MQFDQAGQVVRRVKWYWVANDRPFINQASDFGSANWSWQGYFPTGLGERWDSTRPYSKGQGPTQFFGHGTCGPPTWWTAGAPSSWTPPPGPPYPPGGLPGCCSGLLPICFELGLRVSPGLRAVLGFIVGIKAVIGSPSIFGWRLGVSSVSGRPSEVRMVIGLRGQKGSPSKLGFRLGVQSQTGLRSLLGMRLGVQSQTGLRAVVGLRLGIQTHTGLRAILGLRLGVQSQTGTPSKLGFRLGLQTQSGLLAKQGFRLGLQTQAGLLAKGGMRLGVNAVSGIPATIGLELGVKVLAGTPAKIGFVFGIQGRYQMGGLLLLRVTSTTVTNGRQPVIVQSYDDTVSPPTKADSSTSGTVWEPNGITLPLGYVWAQQSANSFSGNPQFQFVSFAYGDGLTVLNLALSPSGAQTLTVPNRWLSTTPPSYYLLDFFTDTNGTPLTSHTMDLGPGWLAAQQDLTIESNSAEQVTNNVPPEGTNDVFSNASQHNASVSVSCKFPASPGYYGGVVGRYTSDGQNGWYMVCNNTHGPSPLVELYEHISGGFTQRASAVTSDFSGQTHRVEMQLNGTSISCLIDGSVVLSYASSGELTNTYWGLTSFKDSTHGAMIFNNFSVQQIP